MDTPTRDITTKQEYLKRTMSFIKRAYKEALEENHDILKNEKNITLHSFGSGNSIKGLTLYNTCVWACKNWSKTISQDSWRSYRSAFIFTSEIFFHANVIDEDTHKRIENVLKKTKGANKKDLEIRTSAKKQKHLSIKDLKIIDEHLSFSKSMWSMPTRLWLRAGILTGLRPVEWRNASLKTKEGRHYLVVKNAKHTNNRGNGEFRTLHLNHLTQEDIVIIANHLKVVSNFKDDNEQWSEYYKGCANLLKVKNKKAFPNRKKYPTLYSARHQFSANSKASGCTPEELAALMGHATDLTAQALYGKKVNGTRARKPEVEKNEVDSVRRNKKTEKYFTFKNKHANKPKTTIQHKK